MAGITSTLENAIWINLTTLGKHCCLIVNSFEKNYREKELIGLVESAVGGPEQQEAERIKDNRKKGDRES